MYVKYLQAAQATKVAGQARQHCASAQSHPLQAAQAAEAVWEPR